MGGVRFFRELGEVHGKKITKFKQRRYIGELASASNNDQTLASLYEQVSSGICVALSLDWLATRCGVSMTNYHTGDHSHNALITASAAPIQKEFMIDLKEEVSSVSERMKRMAAGFGLGFAKFQVPVGGKNDEAVKSLVAVLNRSEFGDHFLVVMQMKVGNSSPSHATGIERGPGSVYFFDPGIGEYKVIAAKYQAFFSCYFRLKAAHWNGSNLIVSVYAVSRA